MNEKRLNIGVITKDVEDFYFGTMLKGILRAVNQEDARLIVINTYMLNRFRSETKWDVGFFPISYNFIDGWIILTGGVSEEFKIKLLEKDKPVVLIGHGSNDYNCSVLIHDNYDGTKKVIDHLISHGHKRIAYLGSNSVYDMTERLDDYKKILEGYGLYDESLVYNVTAAPMPNVGKEAAQVMVQRGIDFTAVFAANDHLAFGLIEGLREYYNIQVPQDIAVVGYDNTDKSKIFQPPLSSIDQNTFEMGFEAGKKLFELINSKILRSETILTKSILVCRESCGCKMESKSGDKLSKDLMQTKKSMIERLEDVLYKNSDLATKFFTMDINQIFKLIPEIICEYKWFCYGLMKNDKESMGDLVIQTAVDKIKKVTIDKKSECSLENFPPLEVMPDYKLEKDDVLWIVPISTEKKDIGVMAYVSEMYADIGYFAYDIHMLLFNLLGISIDRELTLTELKETLNSLGKTQEQLIESEKLVSLGNLVAGVAHEINNPIGVGVTATTYMESSTNQIKNLFETNKLTKTELSRYLEKSNESLKILLLNLNKASNLIKSFKQIAVDNTIDEKRIFKVKDYVNDVILSLKPKIRKKDLKVNLECSDDLEFYCNPGELAQILTNLILNSIMHGYDEVEKGEISIRIEKNDMNVIIEYEDDGRGMEKEVQDRIFEPFFTTKSEGEGSGLGLNIVSNIIRQKFGGTIACTSEINKGTRFVICMPLSGVS